MGIHADNSRPTNALVAPREQRGWFSLVFRGLVSIRVREDREQTRNQQVERYRTRKSTRTCGCCRHSVVFGLPPCSDGTNADRRALSRDRLRALVAGNIATRESMSEDIRRRHPHLTETAGAS